MKTTIRRWWLSILTVAVIAYWSAQRFWWSSTETVDWSDKTAIAVVEQRADNEEKETIETILPTHNADRQELTLIGTMISNETANVYPRRSGIIKDLYVDIGDSISAGQKIWFMLPPGVEWQSNAAIYEKQVKVEEAKSNLSTTQLTAQEKVQEAINNLKYAELTAAEKIRQVELELELAGVWENSATMNKEMIDSIHTERYNTEEMLRVMTETHQRINQSLDDDMEQLLQQSDIMYVSMIEMMEHIFLGEEHNNERLLDQNINDWYWARDPTTRNDAKLAYRQLINALVTYQENKEIWDRDARIQTRLDFAELVNNVANSMRVMLDYSLNIDGLTQDSLSEKEQKLLDAQSMLVMNEEKLIDLMNKTATTHAMQQWEVTSMETMLASIDAKLEALGAQIKTDIEKKQQKVALTIAEQRAMLQAKEDMVDLAHATEQAMIQAKQNMVNITQSQLNKEYAVSSNQYIISPFDGIVSKRMANVGDVVSMSMPLYELVNVPTSLAKQAKKEIQFWLPEEYADRISKDDIIQYSVASDPGTNHEAIVTRIAPQVDDKTRTITIQAKVNDATTIPHQTSVDVHLPLSEASFYQIPTSSLIYSGSSVYIGILEWDKILRTLEINVVSDDGEYADIQGDIDSTTKVVKNYKSAKRIIGEGELQEGGSVSP